MVNVYIIFGPSGCGKSSVASALSPEFKCVYIEGDTLHPSENVEKMRNGIPLNDDDRWQWLRTVKQKFLDEAEAIKACKGNKSVFVTCSALKLSYRKLLRDINRSEIKIIFIHLRVSRNFLSQRLLQRKGHYMTASMLDSQLEILEEPKPDEANVWIIDANQEFETIISILNKKVASELSS